MNQAEARNRLREQAAHLRSLRLAKLATLTKDEHDWIVELLKFDAAASNGSPHSRSALRKLDGPLSSADLNEGAPHLLAAATSIQCPHCHWGFDPSVIEQHMREKHGSAS
jgi:hypothetical protein